MISSALLVSGVCFVFLGTHLIIQDKTSYIYDYAASQVGAFSRELNSVLTPIAIFGEKIEKADLATKKLAVDSLSDLLQLKVKELPKKEPAPQSIDIHVTQDQKALEIILHFSDGRQYQFLNEHSSINENLISQEFNLCVISPKNKRILYGIERGDGFLCQMLVDQLKTEFQSGAKEINLNGQSYILSYDSVLSGNIMVYSAVPKSVAFKSAKSLQLRSLLLGISLFLLVLGLALILVKILIKRIEYLTDATKHIAEGNFNVNISGGRADSADEILVLIHGFNFMTQKISALLLETAEKARMQKELETAELVQKQFLPQTIFHDDDLKIEGMSESASECGGDFWQYSKVGDRLYFVFGDITGHGVPAALLTSSVYATFVSVIERAKNGEFDSKEETEILPVMSQILNTVVYSAGGGESNFPCFIGIFNLKSNLMHFVNHSHPSPLMWDQQKNKWSSVRAETSMYIGVETLGPVVVESVAFDKGASILFYTDGVFDQRVDNQKQLNKKHTYDFFAKLMLDKKADQSMVKEIMQYALQFFGDNSENRPDDLTFALIERNGIEVKKEKAA